MNISHDFFTDDIIFHYTKLETAIEKILPKNRLRFSSFENVNDPIEIISRSISIYWENNEINGEHVDNIKYEDIVNTIRLEESKLLCFSMNNSDIRFGGNSVLDRDNFFESGFFKLRMWDQYGNNHKGLCIALSKSQLEKDMCVNYDNYIWKSGAVSYNNSVLKAREAYQIKANNHLIDDFKNYFLSDYLEENYAKLYFTKIKDWQNENEYRLLLIGLSGEEYYLNIKNSIRAIFCGLNFPNESFSTLRSIIDDNTIPIYQLDIKNGIPGVNCL